MFLTRINANIGQATLEYAVVLGLVVAALTMMQVYVRRGIQSAIKLSADEIGRQEDSIDLDPARGRTLESAMRTVSTDVNEIQHSGGALTVITEETSEVVEGHSIYVSGWEEDEE